MNSKIKHPEIFDWTAKRSGAHMTVTGKAVDGRDLVLSRVTRIQNGLAFSELGGIHRLVVEA